MKITKAEKVTFIALGGVIVALLVLSSFFDLSLSLAVYKPSSFFGLFFDVFGQAPCYLMLPLSFSFIFAFCYKKQKTLYKVGLVLSVIASIIVWFIIIKMYFGSSLELWLEMLISLPLNALLFAFISFSEQTKIKLVKFAFFAIIVIALSILINQGLKFLWGRYRFRDLYRADTLNNFTPWWKINGINGNKSFPSGHVTAATTMFSLLYLLKLFNVKKISKVLLAVGLGIYVVCVAYSRIVIGAHYLSDVTMGFAVTFVIYTLLYNLYSKYEEKVFSRLINEEE